MAKTDMECKDGYIDHLAFLLNPHLSHLPPEVADKIRAMPGEIRVIINPTDHHVPKPVKDIEAGLVNTRAGELCDTFVVDA